MSGDLMRIGSSALGAAYAQLQTTGHNIANAATPGYSRREVTLQDAGSNPGGGGLFGRGVEVASVRRVYDEFLVRESISNASAAAQDKVRSTQLERLNQLFADPEAGVGASFDNVLAAFADVAARPADKAARTVALTRVDVFAQRVGSLDGRLAEIGDTAQAQITHEVRRANEILGTLSELNKTVAATRGSGREPSDLLDQRDKLLGDLNKILRTQQMIGPDNTVSIHTARGEPLLVGDTIGRLAAQNDPMQPGRLQISVTAPDSPPAVLDAPALGGGVLAGLARFVDEDLAGARLRLGQIAGATASALNRQQALGVDAKGAAGLPLLALRSPVGTPVAGNGGDGVVAAKITDGSKLVASDYMIGFDGSNYSVTRRSDGSVSQFATLPAEIDGLSFSLESGTMQAGDAHFVRSASMFATGLRALQIQPERLATALPVVANAAGSNSGSVTAQLTMQSVDAATNEPVSVRFLDATTIEVSGNGTGNPGPMAYTPGMELSYNGWTLKLDGVGATGDRFEIRPNTDPAGDNRNARAMQALGQQGFVDGATLVDRYAELVGEVGSRGQSAAATASMSARLSESANAARDASSGVNLDEEAARLMQYQHAYQAAAKVVQAANEMFRSLLESTGH